MVELLPCATCGAHCPVRTDTRAYVDLIAQGRYEDAFEKIREFNPFPSVCGLICHHPCEAACRRQNVDEPVGLRHLKRFAVERALEYRRRMRKPSVLRSKKTVGIVGAGPAGLTAAGDLIRDGFPVTVYDAHSAPGGLLAFGVPRYRLPREALQEDLDDLLGLGIELRTGIRVGRDIHLGTLIERHDSLIVATGLPLSRSLPLENGDHPNVQLALPFLEAAAIGCPKEVKEAVLVVGGGNVAVDVARTAVRLGAKTVRMVCLEDEKEMPAWDWECAEALEEGITFVYRRGPIGVVVENERLVGLTVRRVIRVFDEEGRFDPVYQDDERETLPCQTVILAIGQAPDLDFTKSSTLEEIAPDRLAFDPSTMSSSRQGVFLCGEVVTGPGSAIEAVASGHRAAKAVAGYLKTGEALAVDEEEVEAVGDLPSEVIDRLEPMPRVAMRMQDPDSRKESFVPVEMGYSEEEALREARRCLSCGAGAFVDEDKCAACLACLRICPFGVPDVNEVAKMASEMCQACGLCAVECPAVAISIRRLMPIDPRQRMSALMEEPHLKATRLEYCCSHEVYEREALEDRIVKKNGDVVAVIMVPCVALLDEVDMMKPFEWDVQQVIVRSCLECRIPGAEDRLRKRLTRTQGILDAAGVGGDRLVLAGQEQEH